MFKTPAAYIEFFESEQKTFGLDVPHLVPVDVQPPFQLRTPYEATFTWTLRIVNHNGTSIHVIDAGDVDGREDVPQNWFWWSYNGGTEVGLQAAKYYRYKWHTSTGYEYFSEPWKPCADVTHYLEWWQDCDLGDTIYQYGFKNKIYFEMVQDFPDVVTDEVSAVVDGVALINAFSVVKQYKINLLHITEYGLKALELIRYHVRKGTVQLVEIGGATTPVLETDVEFEAFNQHLLTGVITLSVDQTVSNACCQNQTLNIAQSI